MQKEKAPLITWTDKGLYCAAGSFFIDPTKAVDTALITHAHSDHARRGSRRYFCTTGSVRLLKARLGQQIQLQSFPYRQTFTLGDVQVSFHPAGHILGSAQIRVQRGSEVWVASGDFKRETDPSCDPFELIPCDTFITEATFGTPKYRWEKHTSHGKQIFNWWNQNAERGKNSILFAYSLGKAQRILAELAPYAQRPIILHPSMIELTQCYEEEGRKLAPVANLETIAAERALYGDLILAPPSILKTGWLNRFGEFETAFASGWMQNSSHVHGVSYDHGFVLSDHADWNDLNQTINETGARQVFVLNRATGALVRHLRKRGLDAHPVTALTPENYCRLAPMTLPLFPM